MGLNWSTTSPPSWCKNAIPTSRGWLNPDTLELEVSSKFLEDSYDYDYAISQLESGKPLKKSIEKVVQEVAQEVIVDIVESQVIKKPRGRPKTKVIEVKPKRPRGRPKMFKNTDIGPFELL